MSNENKKHTYAAMLAKEGFIQAFFTESSVGLNLCRMDGFWLESNPAFLKIIGYEAHEADDGKLSYWQLTPRKYDANEEEQLKALLETGRYGPYEKEFIRKDGTLVPVRLNGFIVEANGEKMIWSFIEDISAERSLEIERLKAIHASKLSALGEMAASIAHEVNNPLAIISGYAYLLPQAIQGGDDDLVEEAISEIQRATERAGEITAGLRRLSRGNASDKFEVFDVRSVISDAAKLTGARTRAEGLELELDVRTEGQTLGNPVQLGQVLINLLNNAVDAVKKAPTRRVALRARDVNNTIELRVEDTGPGVEESHRLRLFDRFFTTKSPNEGTGLGLSVSQEIVTSMGGTIRYERSDDCTAFIVQIPSKERV